MRCRSILALPLLATLLACGGDGDTPPPAAQTTTPTPAPTPSPTPTPAPIILDQFGFSAIACDHDDPFDNSDVTDYGSEVSAFSNLNQVCPTGDVRTDTARLRGAAAMYDPLLYIEPVFFDPATAEPRDADVADALWAGLQQAIGQSGVDPARIIFYLFDEPTLRGVSLSSLEPVAARIRSAYPNSSIMLIEAFSDSADPTVPAFVDVWGFNAYTVADPAAEPRYTGYLDKAAAQLRTGQALALIGDGIHTPFHAGEGLSEADMADVASNYLALARSREDVAMLLVYTWAGGIDNDQERGVRDLPQSVAREWERIGREIIGK